MERGPSLASFCVNPGALRYEVARKLDVFRRPGARRGPMKKRPIVVTTRVDRARCRRAAAREPCFDSLKVSDRGGLSNLIWKLRFLFRVAIHLKFAVASLSSKEEWQKKDTYRWRSATNITRGSTVQYCECLTSRESIAAVVYDAPQPDDKKASVLLPLASAMLGLK